MIALVCLSVAASFWFMSEACKGEIMKPRRRPLRCLDSFQNIFGREAFGFNNKTREITFGSIGGEDQRKKRRNVACVE